MSQSASGRSQFFPRLSFGRARTKIFLSRQGTTLKPFLGSALSVSVALSLPFPFVRSGVVAAREGRCPLLRIRGDAAGLSERKKLGR